MAVKVYRLEYYRTQDGGVPFGEWLAGLRDPAAIARVRIRLNRLRLGNFGMIRMG